VSSRSELELIEFLNKLRATEKTSSNSHKFELIEFWEKADVLEVEELFKTLAKQIIGTKPRGINSKNSNQSLGNVYHKYIVEEFNKLNFGPQVILKNLSASGYPDSILIIHEVNGNRIVCVEIKATSKWNSKDANRRVLMSSTKKLVNLIELNNFINVPLHLVATLIYNKSNNLIESLRIDFIDPNFRVNTRFEASTSHKSLDSGEHRKLLLTN
jgi:hypothetical protein